MGMDPKPHGLSLVVYRCLDLLVVAVIYLTSELVVWGLSQALTLAGVPYFASIVGMVAVFATMTVLTHLFEKCDGFYHCWIKAKVDFINAHMSVGFPIPIVSLEPKDMLKAREIGSIIGAFLVTGMASWTLIFGLSFLTMKVAIRLRRFLRRSSDSHSLRSESFWSSGSTFTTVVETEYKGDTGPDDGSPAVSPQASFYKTRGSTHSGKIINYYPIVLSLTCALAIGAPVAAATKDTRLLDGCALWFSWISAVRIQGWMKNSSLWAQNPSAKKACSTCLNPVLLTILVMLGYVRAKAAATPGVDLPYIIKKFRCGRPLYHIWTESIRESTSSEKTSHYFGAGDAALSLLECGMVVWGFRLYECRRQLFSMTGIVTVIVSAAAAAGNVYFSVACARVMGLDTPEALSFAARSVTLALARPAVQTAGGNLAVNAAIVVSNGIVGQLICPYALAALKVQHECPAAEPMILSSSVTSTKDADIGDDGQRASIWVQDVEKPPGTRISQEDDAMTVAAGMAIGINGAAMGVAYLYESKNRAAPYSALAMTVFGVMTVVFTAAGPFKDTVLNLAGV